MPKEVISAVRAATSKVTQMVQEQFDSIGHSAVTNDEELAEKIGKPGGGNYFIKALEMKANNQEVLQLNERKTNKEDSEMMMRSLDIMHK